MAAKPGAKKPAGKRGGKSMAGPTDVPSGILQESTFPIFVEEDMDFEEWGNVEMGTAVPQNEDQIQFFTDAEFGPIESMIGEIKEWKRPHAIFCPFKPHVVQMANLTSDPYASANPDPLAPIPGTRSPRNNAQASPIPNPVSQTPMLENIKAYRTVKAFKTNAIQSKGNSSWHKRQESVRALGDTSQQFMAVFQNALMAVHTAQQLVPKGKYLWELIYPQQILHETLSVPIYNPCGKYVVKLFWNGCFRKVMIDDRLPTDTFGNSLFTVTNAKEIWPALLAKAMLKVVSPHSEQLFFEDPNWCISTLMGGWIPQIIRPVLDGSAALLKTMRDQVLLQRKLASSEASDAVSAAEGAPPKSAGEGKKKDDKKGGGANAISDEEQQQIDAQPTKLLMMAIPRSSCDDVEKAGLVADASCLVLDVVPYGQTSLLRLVAPKAQWTGQYAYSSNAWTPDFEKQIGFQKANKLASDNQWNDFWLEWDTFYKLFDRVVFFRDVNSPKCRVARRVTLNDALAETTSEPTEGGGPASKHQPDVLTKYLYIKTSCPTQLLLVYTGYVVPPPPPPPQATARGGGPRPSNVHQMPPPTITLAQRESVTGLTVPGAPVVVAPSARQKVDTSPPGIFEVQVHGYNWQSATPVAYLTTFSAARKTTNSVVLQVPKGEHAYRLDMKGFAVESLFAILSSNEVVWTDEETLCTNYLNLSIWADETEFKEHLPNEWNIWFKYHLFVKGTTKLIVDLSATPIDPAIAAAAAAALAGGAANGGGVAPITARSTVSQTQEARRKPSQAPDKAPTGGKKGKGDPGEPKIKKHRIFHGVHDKLFNLEKFPGSTEQDLLALLSRMKLIVVNCDTNAVTEGVINRLPLMSLAPNQKGYILMAHGATPTANPAGLYRVQVVSDMPLEKIESKPYDSFFVKTGEYSKNSQYQLFKYNITVTDPAHLSAQVHVADQTLRVPYTITVHHNTDIIFQSENVYNTTPTYIPNLVFQPSEKTVNNRYQITCTLNSAFAEHIHHQLQEAAIANFRAEKDKKAKQQQASAAETLSSPVAAVTVVGTPTLSPRSDPGAPKSPANKGGLPRNKSKEGLVAAAGAAPPTLKPGGKDARDRSKSDAGILKKGDAAAQPAPVEPPPVQTWSPPPLTPNQVVYCLRLHCSTSKLLIEPDQTLQEEIQAIKQRWGTKAGTPVPPPTTKGAKDAQKTSKDAAKAQNAVMDASTQRLQKAKEAREKFYTNLLSDGFPNVTVPDEADALQNRTMTELSDHGGVGADTPQKTKRQLSITPETTKRRSRASIAPSPGPKAAAGGRPGSGGKERSSTAATLFGGGLEGQLVPPEERPEGIMEEREKERKELSRYIDFKESQLIALRLQRQQTLLEDRRQQLTQFWSKKDPSRAIATPGSAAASLGGLAVSDKPESAGGPILSARGSTKGSSRGKEKK